MYRFRLKLSTVGVSHANDGRKTAQVIPQGAELMTGDADVEDPSANGRKLVSVVWEGRSLGIFLVDLLERAERVRHAGG